MILIRKGDFSLKRRPKGDQKWSKSLLRRPWSPKGDLIGNAGKVCVLEYYFYGSSSTEVSAAQLLK